MTLVALLVIVATTIWIAIDARNRDWSSNRFADASWKWIVGALLLWIVAFPAYLVQRSKAPVKN